MHPIINIAIKAARRGGKIILRHFDRLAEVEVRQKAPNDFVSAVDLMVEEDIINTISYAYPEHNILAEERGGELGDDQDDQYQWIIDPVDGTFNYLHHHPHFAISIAVRQRGQVQHAVIFDPLRDEIYRASYGQGAYLNSRRIHVSKQRSLAQSLLATGFPHRVDLNNDANAQQFNNILPKVASLRLGGAAVLDLAYVANGRLDGYWQSGLKPWDIAAGELLVREAGGLVTDLNGEQNFMQSGAVVAANPNIFEKIIRTLVMK